MRCGMPPSQTDTYAVQDIGMVVDHLRELYHFTNDPEETLAVLRNKNRLVHTFCRSGWIQDTEGMVLSRSILLCRNDSQSHHYCTNANWLPK